MWTSGSQEIVFNVVKHLTIVTDERQIPLRRRYIVQFLYIYVRQEKEWENVMDFGGGGAPKMTTLQSKALSLLIHLEPAMAGILNEAQTFTRQMIFEARNNLGRFKMCQLANVCRFFLLISRHLGKIFQMHLFVVFFTILVLS